MNLLVLIKHVPDTEAKITVAGGGKFINEESINFVLNPYDEFALEEALRLKERHGGQVTVVTLGPERAKEALRTALAMGADEAVHLRDDALEGGDALSASVALARALKDIHFDLILCGKQAIDDDSCQVGPRVAELLGIPQVTVVTKLDVDPNARTARAHREMDGYGEVVETPLPALISAQKGLNEPRFPSLPGIMKAKRKEIKTLNLASLGLDAAQAGRAGQGAEVRGLEVPSRARLGKVLTAEPPAAAAELAAMLRGEAKVL